MSKVSPETIQAAIDRCTFQVVSRPDGTTSTFVHVFLDGVFYLASGHSACVDPSEFNAVVGEFFARKRAEEAARNKLWELYGFQLYDNLRANAMVPQEVPPPLPNFPVGNAYPAYRSHKVVRAFWISRIESGPASSTNTWMLYPTDGSLPAYEVSHEFRVKHDLKPGDILMFYQDGYVSVSPLNAFNDGYTRIEP